MAPNMLGGILVPVVTPFARDGEVEGAAFMMNVRAHIESGLSGIVTAGSTGEAALLTEQERLELIQLVRPIVPADRWLIAGIGAESTRTTVQRARDSAARGADAVLVVAPHYYGAQMTNTALSAHYHRVADDSPVPLVLYNIPKYAHFALSPELVSLLSRHHNVIGIKDSSGEVNSLRGYLLSQSQKFSVLTGSGSGLLEALELGASGGVLAVACFAEPIVREVYEGLRRGDRPSAARAQTALVALAREVVGLHGPAGVKAAMQLVGLRGGAVRAPLLDLTEAEVTRIRTLLQALA